MVLGENTRSLWMRASSSTFCGCIRLKGRGAPRACVPMLLSSMAAWGFFSAEKLSSALRCTIQSALRHLRRAAAARANAVVDNNGLERLVVLDIGVLVLACAREAGRAGRGAHLY